MKLIIAGARNDLFTQADIAAHHRLDEWIGIDEVVSGGCRGADKQRERWANAHGLPVKPFSARWPRHPGRSGASTPSVSRPLSAANGFWACSILSSPRGPTTPIWRRCGRAFCWSGRRERDQLLRQPPPARGAPLTRALGTDPGAPQARARPAPVQRREPLLARVHGAAEAGAVAQFTVKQSKPVALFPSGLLTVTSRDPEARRCILIPTVSSLELTKATF